MLNVEVVTTTEGFRALEKEWNDLVLASSQPSVFLTHEWLFTWWENFQPKDACIKFLTIRDSERALVGIVPLFEQTKRQLGTELKTLYSFSNQQSPKSDFIIRADREDEVFVTIIEYFLKNTAWGKLELKKVPERFVNSSSWLNYLETRGCRFLVRAGSRSPYLHLDSNWENYYQTLSKKFRLNTDRAERSLKKKGSFEFTEIRNSPELDKFLDRAFALEAAGWKGNAGVAVALSEAKTNFYRTLAHRTARNDWFRLYFLTLDGRPIAFSYCLQYRDRASLIRIGYDPDYSKDSPGSVMQKLLVMHLFHQEDVRVYDLLEGNAFWKARWTNTLEQSYSFLLYPPGLTGRTSYWLKTGWLSSKDFLKKTPLHGIYQRCSQWRHQRKQA